jgi:transcriptional regulator of acetoin/glycerol metabolism
MEYFWPGNVRELKSCFEYAFVSCQETIIQPRHLPPRLRQEGKAQKLIPIPSSFDRNEKKRVALIDALKRSGGNRSEAARMLGISRVTVWNRMKRYGIDARIG